MLTREVLVLFHSTLAAVTNTARGFPSPSTRSESPHLPLYIHSWLVHHPLSLREKEPSTLDVSQSIIPLSCTIESIPGLIRSNLPSSFQPSNYQWEVEPTPPLFSCRKITLAAACDQDIEDGIQYLSSTGWCCPSPLFPDCGGKNQDEISHCSSFKPPNLPAIVSSFALSDKRYNI